MAFFPCSGCGKRQPGKFAAAYVAWFDRFQQRFAYKQRLCFECAGEMYGAPLRRMNQGEPINQVCINCQNDDGVTEATVFVKLYLPKHEPLEIAFSYCLKCWDAALAQIQATSEPLPNRSDGQGAGAPAPDPDRAWDVLLAG